MSQVKDIRSLLAKPLWIRSLLWLAFLGPFFFLSYGYSNQFAAERAVTREIIFSWEQHIPFLPWTIIPYWSIDLLYGFSFLLCTTRQMLNRHALRLLTAQIIAVACFMIYPLTISVTRMSDDGVFGRLFSYLYTIDMPYNQMPSLHITLLLILWERYSHALPARWRWLVHGWAILIGISVLTTSQHHFIDIPTGLLLASLVMWLWPIQGQPPLTPIKACASSRMRLSAYYLLAGLLSIGLAALLGGTALWLCWPAAALLLLSIIYAFGNPHAFQKENGCHLLPVRIILFPATLGAWLNSRFWTRRHATPTHITANVWLGRMPTKREMQKLKFVGLCDLSAELPAPRGEWRYRNVPCLDLVTPSESQLRLAATDIEQLQNEGKTLVCCALGFSRSVCALIAWLLLTHRVKNLEEATEFLRIVQPSLVLNQSHLDVLRKLES